MRIFQKGLLDIFILALLWGPSYLFMKIALNDMTPITVITLRICFGAFFLAIIVKLKQIHLPKNLVLWGHGLVLGFFANSFPFLCFNYSITTIPTSLSAVINGTTPILTILLANFFLKDEKITLNRALGVALGLLGFFVLFLPSIFGLDISSDFLGMFLSFLGSCSYAVAMIYARLFVKDVPPFVIPMIQLLTSVMYLIPLALLVDDPLLLMKEASLSTWGAILGLGFLGTALAFILYYRILARQGATALSMVTYLLPIIGTILGVSFLNEQLSVHFIIAATLILGGIMVVNGAIPLKKLKHKRYSNTKEV